MADNIILFPQIAQLQEEIKSLKAELCDLLYKRDELAMVECKNIEARYMIQLGSLEVALYKIQCKVMKAKRKMSIIQQKLNRKENISLQEIDEFLNAEYSQYMQKLESAIKQVMGTGVAAMVSE